MCSREEQFRQEDHKPKRSHRNTPSFSSSLLEEICRSIDDEPQKPTPATTRFSRTTLVEKWMENDKSLFRRRPKCDNAVFPDNTSTSTSSNSSSVDPTASDMELLAGRPKPVRTRHRDCYLFDERERNRSAAGSDKLIKSESRALRLYSNLKKMKQPISPGARLTCFINSIFSGLKTKKPKESKETDRIDHKAVSAPWTTKTMKSTDRLKRRPRCELPCVAAVDREIVGGGTRVGDAFGRRKCDVGKGRCWEEEEDVCSESSSDVFELDDLSLFGNRDGFCQQLRLYETLL